MLFWLAWPSEGSREWHREHRLENNSNNDLFQLVAALKDSSLFQIAVSLRNNKNPPQLIVNETTVWMMLKLIMTWGSVLYRRLLPSLFFYSWVPNCLAIKVTAGSPANINHAELHPCGSVRISHWVSSLVFGLLGPVFFLCVLLLRSSQEPCCPASSHTTRIKTSSAWTFPTQAVLLKRARMRACST